MEPAITNLNVLITYVSLGLLYDFIPVTMMMVFHYRNFKPRQRRQEGGQIENSEGHCSILTALEGNYATGDDEKVDSRMLLGDDKSTNTLDVFFEG